MAELQYDFEAEDELEVLLGGEVYVDWVDDVIDYKCVRCKRVLVQHYISNCEHKFCSNCKRVTDDGSERWRCPECNEFIKNMDRQDFDFRDRVRQLRVHCLNNNYGCPHVCTLKELKGHMRECEYTRERALPVLYKGNIPQEMLEQMSMLRESNAEMRLEMSEMRQKMMEMDRKREEDKAEVETTLRNNKDRLDEVYFETKRLSYKLQELKINQSEGNTTLKIEENKAKILKLEHKSEFWLELLDKKEKSLSDLITKTRKDLEKDLQILRLQTENEVTSMKSENDSKFEEMALIKLLDLKESLINERINSLNEDFKKQQTKYSIEIDEFVHEINRINEKSEKMETKFKKVKAEVESRLKTHQKKQSVEDLDKKMMDKVENEFEKRFQLKTSIFQIKPQMDIFNLVEKNLHFQPDLIWKISGIKELVKRRRFEVKSEVFAWNGYPVKAQAKLELKLLDSMYLSLNLVKHNDGNFTMIKPIPTVYYVVRDQSKNSETKHICRAKNYLDTSFLYTFDYEKKIKHKSRFFGKPWFTNNLYNVDDCVVIEIYVEPPHVVHMIYSYDGTLNWSIDSYRKRKQMEEEGLIWCQESPYFYTGPRGYRVRACMYLDGFGEHKGKGLSVLFNFLPSEFDAELSKNFPHQTTVTLLNRKYPELSIVKRVDQNIEDKDYSLDMCNSEEIDRLLENDTLFCNIMIKLLE